MNLTVQKIKINPQSFTFRNKPDFANVPQTSKQPENIIPVYGDDKIRTNPAQLSLFAMHDFHGQNIRMERAYSAATQFDRGTLYDDSAIFDKNKPVDKFKVASGDMFLGENTKELQAVNEFLNISGVMASAMGNHECDAKLDVFADIVKNKQYRLLGANMHPDNNAKIQDLISNSFIVESNGNRYGFIGLVPPDMTRHLKRPEDVEDFNISNMEDSIKDLQNEIDKFKKQGVNKIVLLSHMGLENEKFVAQNVSDIDIILGGHTHNLMTEVKEGENLFLSPKNEPVLIMQVGRDGEHIGIPNVQFNEFGQITKIQYNVLDTDDFARSLIAKNAIEKVIGKPDKVGRLAYVEEPPSDIYAMENPHCDFIVDCMKSELDTDVAIMNSSNIRGRFYQGDIDTRELALISPFGNKIMVIEASEAELVDRMNSMIKKSMQSEFHRPGIFQVSGMRYEYSQSQGKMTKLSFVDNYGHETPIDLDNPREDKIYTVAVDDYCAKSEGAGLNLKHRYDTALLKFDCDKDAFVESYLRNHEGPVYIKSDGRIKTTD